MYKNPYEIQLCYLISVSLKEHRRSQGLTSWHKVHLNYSIKHTCISDFVWYNMYEDGRECTDSTPPSQSVRFPRAGFPLLYLLLFLHSHRKRRLESRLFLVYRLMNVLQWPQACYGSSGLPVNREGAEYHEYFWNIVPDDCLRNSHCYDVEITFSFWHEKSRLINKRFPRVSGRPFSPLTWLGGAGRWQIP